MRIGFLVGAALIVGLAGIAEDTGPPRSEYRVELDTRADVDLLTEAGVIVGSVRESEATVFGRPDDITLLREWGFDPEPITVGREAPFGYPTYDEMAAQLQTWAETYDDIARLTSLGTSVEGRQLWAIRINTDPDTPTDKPAFKYVSTMHGDEPLGTVLMMKLIERLLTDFDTDERITDLVESTDIWIVPLMNPDGYEVRSRFNANGVDLNRDFPIYPNDFTGTLFDDEPLHDEGREPETVHIMRWTAENRFVLSANLHTGSLVVNYPYDDDGGRSGVEQPTPDDALFRDLSLRYAMNNPTLYNSTEFPFGITNGAAWYVIRGGMQDWNYRYAACKEVTLELSYIKAPPSGMLTTLWLENEESLLTYLEAVHIGVRGIVSDADTGAPVEARIRVDDNPQPVFTNPVVGHYHRLLLPGTYTLTVDAPGYHTAVIEHVEVEDGPATVVDIALEGKAVDDDPNDEKDPWCPFGEALKTYPDVLASLRGFRDDSLRNDPLGTALVAGYYRAAPSLAEAVRNHDSVRDLFSAVGALAAGRFSGDSYQ